MIARKSSKKQKVAIEKKENLSIKPKIEKITVNIGVGEAGERLKKAETILHSLTGQKPVQTLSRTTSKDWGIRKKMPIGCKVTLRKKNANKFLIEALKTKENKIADYSIDNQGNFSFGIPDYTLFEGQKYDPNIGIFGMDISVTIEKPGYRVKRRHIGKRHIPKRHQVTKEETINFIKNTFKVEVVE